MTAIAAPMQGALSIAVQSWSLTVIHGAGPADSAATQCHPRYSGLD